MAKDGLLALICAGGLLVAGADISRLQATDDDRNSAVTATLAVQTAMQQGRDYLQRGDARSAVFALESQLSRINGNPAYLALLRDAYRTYVKELRLANQDADAQRYLQRLLILDPGAALDAGVGRPATQPAPAAPAKTSAASPQGEPKVRAQREDDDPFRPTAAVKEARPSPAAALLSKAEDAFAKRRYQEAGTLFEQAHQADPAATQSCRERWGYCKLYGVVEKLNQQPADTPPAPELEREVRSALELAPRLECAQLVLAEIQKRRNAGQAAAVRHYPRGNDGWARAETTNFRIFHNQTRELAEQVALIAEQTRTEMGRKWFGGLKEDWNPRCDLYLHATAQDYSRITGVSPKSPGHSSLQTEGSRVLSRRIDLHCDDVKNLLTGVLPHETTHVVLAGQIGDRPVPRWADEGIAVLTEPRDKVERHLANLARCRQDNTLFSVKQLMEMPDYPEPRRVSAFYAQSVSLVDYLVAHKGPQVFTHFLRDAQKMGYEPALQQHYGYRNYDDLQQRWHQHAFAPKGVAQLGQ